jgi:hypothetical protein
MKKHRGELDIDEDIQLESTNWKVQRVAWVLMALFVLAALLGFTGDGSLNNLNTKTAKAEGLELEYERFMRRDAPAEIKLKIPVRQDELSLQFGKDFYEKLQVEQVIPDPTEVYTHEQGITYRFAATQAPNSVTFYFKPKGIGRMHLQVSTESGRLSVSQFIHP